MAQSLNTSLDRNTSGVRLVYGLYTLGASNAPDPGAISGGSGRAGTVKCKL